MRERGSRDDRGNRLREASRGTCVRVMCCRGKHPDRGPAAGRMAAPVCVHYRAHCRQPMRPVRIPEHGPDRRAVRDDRAAHPGERRIRRRHLHARASPRHRVHRQGRAARNGQPFSLVPRFRGLRRSGPRLRVRKSSGPRRRSVLRWFRGRNLSSSGRRWPRGPSLRSRPSPSRSSSARLRRHRHGPRWRQGRKWPRRRDRLRSLARRLRRVLRRRQGRCPSLRVKGPLAKKPRLIRAGLLP